MEFVLENFHWGVGALEILNGISLSIRSGESVALVGPSGSGKTTLLKALSASLPDPKGNLRIGGCDVPSGSRRTLRLLRSKLGFVHQGLDLVGPLRVIHNVLLGAVGATSTTGMLRMLLAPSEAEKKEVHGILTVLGIGERIFERTDRLSGGEQQRVAVARALYQKPKAVLADEPIASVDPSRGKEIITLLLDISRERGLTCIASLHHFALAREFFPRLVGLRDGTVVFDKPSAEVSADDEHALYHLERTKHHA